MEPFLPEGLLWGLQDTVLNLTAQHSELRDMVGQLPACKTCGNELDICCLYLESLQVKKHQGFLFKLQKNKEVFPNHSSASELTWEHTGFRNMK